MEASVFIASSLDGFIAREDGDVTWLDAPEELSGEDYGYQAFMDTVDVLIMGRLTYEKALTFGTWPYGSKPVVVLSGCPLTIPEAIAGSVEPMAGSPEEVLARLARRGARHAYVDGGKTITGFLRAGLVRRLILTRIPILLGHGIPLFGALPEDIPLRHVETRAYPNGLVQSTYEVAPSRGVADGPGAPTTR